MDHELFSGSFPAQKINYLPDQCRQGRVPRSHDDDAVSRPGVRSYLFQEFIPVFDSRGAERDFSQAVDDILGRNVLLCRSACVIDRQEIKGVAGAEYLLK